MKSQLEFQFEFLFQCSFGFQEPWDEVSNQNKEAQEIVPIYPTVPSIRRKQKLD